MNMEPTDKENLYHKRGSKLSNSKTREASYRNQTMGSV
jgi:hypothetical protein